MGLNWLTVFAQMACWDGGSRRTRGSYLEMMRDARDTVDALKGDNAAVSTRRSERSRTQSCSLIDRVTTDAPPRFRSPAVKPYGGSHPRCHLNVASSAQMELGGPNGKAHGTHSLTSEQ